MKGSTSRRVHPLVYLDYRVRIVGHLIVAVILASIFHERGQGPAVWVAMLAQVVLWPHLAFVNARNARDSKRAELTNLCVDGFIIGCWIGLVSFGLWPTMTFAAALIPAFLSVGGLRFSLVAVLAMVVGSVTMGAITGFSFEPASSALTTGLSIGGILLYASTFGLVTNRQARRIVQSNKTIESQRVEIQQRTALAEQARDAAERLAEVTTIIGGSLDLQQVLDTLIRQAVELADADAGAIFQFNPATRSFNGIASHGLPDEFLERIAATIVDPSEGVIRRAMESGHPFQIPEVEDALQYVFRKETLRAGFHAMLAAPIPAKNITRGVTVFRRAGGRFEPRVVDLVVALANQSKVAIDNARLFQEVEAQRLQLERMSRDIEHLYRLSSALQEPLSLKEQLHRVLEAARQKGILDRIYIWAVNPEATKLVNLVGAGFAEDEWKDFEGTEIPLAEAGAMYKAYRDEVALVFNEANPLPRELALRPPYSDLRAIRTQNFLVIPMIARGETVGVLTGDNKWTARPLLPETVALLQTFASHAAVAIANARLFQAIEEKSQQLEVATRHKSQFLANMSHELRTPLNAIIGYAELMADEIYGEVPERMRDVLDRIQQAGRHLLGLINDVLDLSKIEAGQLVLSLADYSMADVVQTVALAVEPLASAKGLALRVEIPEDIPAGRGDELRLRQVVLNLAGNAVKFTDAGEVALAVKTDGGTLSVSVSDTGPGIAPADQERIFEEFQQATGANVRKSGGTGLGLAIARRIVEMHGGRLVVDSVPGRGSTFTFTVPVRVERRARQLPVTVDRRNGA